MSYEVGVGHGQGLMTATQRSGSSSGLAQLHRELGLKEELRAPNGTLLSHINSGYGAEEGEAMLATVEAEVTKMAMEKEAEKAVMKAEAKKRAVDKMEASLEAMKVDIANTLEEFEAARTETAKMLESFETVLNIEEDKAKGGKNEIELEIQMAVALVKEDVGCCGSIERKMLWTLAILEMFFMVCFCLCRFF